MCRPLIKVITFIREESGGQTLSDRGVAKDRGATDGLVVNRV